MSGSRTHELYLEVCECAAEAVDLIEEFRVANEHGGAGVHRDPRSVFGDLYGSILSLQAAARDARDAAGER
jgi:hypothetical protein